MGLNRIGTRCLIFDSLYYYPDFLNNYPLDCRHVISWKRLAVYDPVHVSLRRPLSTSLSLPLLASFCDLVRRSPPCSLTVLFLVLCSAVVSESNASRYHVAEWPLC